jgi:tetratricopeptide (TPR) repeat protein
MTKRVRATKSVPSRGTVLGVSVFLVAITWLVFGQTLGHQFVNFDDEIYVYENSAVAAGLSLHGIVWAFTHTVCYNWHPLTIISHMLDCQCYGLKPAGHHFTNVLLHTIAVILLFLNLRQMTGALWRSAFVAALFAIHPLRVESVAWVAERKDLLSGVFFMLTLGAYLCYVRRPSLARYLTVAVVFALGLMSKPMLVTLPFVLLLLDYWPLNRFAPTVSLKSKSKDLSRRKGPSRFWRLVQEKIPLLILSTGACAATLLAQGHIIDPIEKLSLPWRVGNALVTLCVYARQMVWPLRLSAFYPHPQDNLSFWEIGLSTALLVAITTGALLWRRKRPYFLTGWFWYVGMLVPVIGIVQVGSQAHADRYTYLPQIGLYLLITWAFADASASWRHGGVILKTVATIVLVIFVGCAWRQTSYWHDSLSLWTHALAVTSNNDTAHDALCDAFLREGKVDEAILHAQMAVDIRPDSSDAHNSLGVALSQRGRSDDALAQFEKVLKINPRRPRLHYNLATVLLQKGDIDGAIAHYQEELKIQPDYAEAHNNLSTALARKGHLEEALAHLQKALEINPNRTQVHYNVAMILLQKGEVDEAIANFQKELKIQPLYADAHSDLGIALSQQGRMSEAITEWQKALEIQPDNINAQSNLAWIFATHPDASIRDGPKAVNLAERVLQLSGRTNPRIFRLLAAAYAESGRFGEAIDAAQKGLQLAVTQDNSALADTLQMNIALYQNNSPLRDAGRTREHTSSNVPP